MQEYQTIFENKNYMNVKRCTDCGSVFITDSECESCGKQFHLNLIGAPLGSNSLYSIKSEFDNSSSYTSELLTLINTVESPELKRYRRSLKRRFEVLLQFLTSNLDINEDNRRKIFLIELKDTIEEMMNKGVPYQWVASQINSVSDKDLEDSLFYWIHSLEHQRTKFSLIDFMLNFRLWGVLRFGTVFLLLSGTVIASSLVLALFRLNY